MMDLDKFESSLWNHEPACNGADQRMDALIALQMETIRELRMLRESLDLQNIQDATADLRVIHAAENRAHPEPVEVDVTQHSTGELQTKPRRARKAK